ncbi:glutamyl-tRNA reductase [Leucothrix pacifica]|uniref:Glutamyl-tRNA reductase n=1 Tax=Leucothrix pacifica TaxID=1247513 RepID=A0A317CLS9_9GAMM|nr:glutamyl-tRNA reductase [Leucothrix pacifica]PWQ99167.1 glutamyl-tRNA reductase [Leucothrix pacifica]
MSIVVIGINHKTAPVSIREKVAFTEQRLEKTLQEELPLFDEKLILSTCNRTEVYASVSDDTPVDTLKEWYTQQHQLENENLKPYVYQLSDAEAIQHTFRVASGLDSMVLGEPQILGQLKTALKTATDHKATGSKLNRLMQHAFSTAKKVRTETEIGSNPVSVAYTAVNLAKQIFGDLGRHTALLIGAGETIELVGRHLHSAGIKQIIIANRSLENAQILGEQFNARIIGLTDIAANLEFADIVISSTASPIPVIGKGSVEKALKKRKHNPIFMVDIAVPRDIEPEVGELNDIYLYTVDDLQSVVDQNIDTRKRAADMAENMISHETQVFMSWLNAQEQLQHVKSYRSQLETVKQEVLNKALQQLRNGKSPEDALQFLAHTLTNKIGHMPTQTMNHAAHAGDLDTLQAAVKLLGLEDNTQNHKEDTQ